MNDRHAISPYPIRMPPDLRQKLETEAETGNRSLHAEIVARLQASFGGKNLAMLGIPRDFTNEANTAGYIASDAYKTELARQRKELQDMIEEATKPVIQKAMEQYLEQERKDRERLIEQVTGIKALKK